MDVASFEFTDFLSDWHLRLVVQRTRIETRQGEQFLPGMEYVYRAILTNDHASTEEQVIDKYNQRGACEKNFDVQNNDFGWAHLPFSTMEVNTVFLLFTAMLKNFYLYLLGKVCGIFPGIDMKSRLWALCLCIHHRAGKVGSSSQAMDTEHLYEGQVAALLVYIQCHSRLKWIFLSGEQLENPMGVRGIMRLHLRMYVKKPADLGKSTRLMGIGGTTRKVPARLRN